MEATSIVAIVFWGGLFVSLIFTEIGKSLYAKSIDKKAGNDNVIYRNYTDGQDYTIKKPKLYSTGKFLYCIGLFIRFIAIAQAVLYGFSRAFGMQ